MKKNNSASRLIRLFEALDGADYLGASEQLLPDNMTVYQRVQLLKFFIGDIASIQSYMQKSGLDDPEYDVLIADLSERVLNKAPVSEFRISHQSTHELVKQLKFILLGMPSEPDLTEHLHGLEELLEEQFDRQPVVVQNILRILQESMVYYNLLGIPIIMDGIYNVTTQVQVHKEDLEKIYKDDDSSCDGFKSIIYKMDEIVKYINTNVAPYTTVITQAYDVYKMTENLTK